MELIRKYFPDLSEEQYEKLGLLGDLYSYWNEKINLISRKDIPHLYEKHILHSLSIYKYYPFPAEAKILDVGTGGGFPGIPLAICNPDATFTLTDSIGKKIKVVKDVIEKLQLKNCAAVNSRAENLPAKFHFIVSRAVTNFPDFHALIHHKIIKNDISTEKENGIIYLKGGDFNEEIKYFRKRMKIVKLSDYFKEEFFETKNILYLPK
ncbi:MAG: 16S rRNA (guanine(527)-N(7))-methyltransferase RsmG [Bacteroidales bacterium]|nr:16S rRNA (guanine(527)-N(7))-methyltransferase RsmG [Bacteroidales bacterium]MCF8389293.1 16S rRNA (guanine(527)-N(7))-methyltransferase RsmG [Bacteroidales bacterium]